MLPQIETIPPAGDAAHILLVEDDDGLRMLVTRLLRESGYRVTGCREEPSSGGCCRPAASISCCST